MVKGGDMDLGFVVSAAEKRSKVGRGKGVNLLWKNSKVNQQIHFEGVPYSAYFVALSFPHAIIYLKHRLKTLENFMT